MRLRVYRSVEAVNGAANALLWKSSKTQNFTYLTILKHQNTKTSLNKLSKNHWVIALFEIFGSVSKKLQSTVFNDHPVVFERMYFDLTDSTSDTEGMEWTSSSLLWIRLCWIRRWAVTEVVGNHCCINESHFPLPPSNYHQIQ